MFFCGNVATPCGACRHGHGWCEVSSCSILFLYTFLNEYYTDLEFLMDFMNIFLYSFFKVYFCDYLLNLHVLR